MKFIVTALAVFSFVACKNNSDAEDENALAGTTPTINYSLVNTYPHDTTSYTEGFLIHEGKMYESTGFTEELPQTRSLFGEVDSVPKF